MADISVTFDANTAPFLRGVKEIRASVNTLSQTLKERRAELLQFSANLSMVFHGVKSAADLAGRMFSTPLKEFSRFEDAATRLAPLVGGLDSARILCAQLRDEAASGTMSFEQLTSVAGRLASVFKSSSDIKKWTTAFHDLSAGTGLDINELIGNFVKSKASGRFEAGFLDMFAQKGVNIFPELVKQTGVAEAELRKMAASGTLSFAEVEKAILAVSTGTGQFAGQAAKMSNTFGGSVGTMVAHWKTLLAEFAKPIAESVKPWVQKVGKLLSESANYARELGASFKILAAGAGIATGAVTACLTAMKAWQLLVAANPILPVAAGLAVAVSVPVFEYAKQCEEARSEVEKLSETNKRLQKAFDSMETAKNAAALKDAAKQAQRLAVELEYAETSLNTDVIRENIRALERKKTAELELAEATRKRAEADAEATENNRKAQDLWKEFSRERKNAADKQALVAASPQERAALFLKQKGYASYGEFSEMLNRHRSWNDSWMQDGQGSEWMVNKVKELEQINDQYVALTEAANKSAEEAAAKEREKASALKEAAAAYARQKALLEAELSGNAKLFEQEKARARYAGLVAQYKSQGFKEADADRMARELLTLETAKELAAESPGAGTRVGRGLVSDELAGVGGGRSMHVGGNENAAVSIARNQLSVMQRSANLLQSIDGALRNSLCAVFA